jgi:hypothetical protein
MSVIDHMPYDEVYGDLSDDLRRINLHTGIGQLLQGVGGGIGQGLQERQRRKEHGDEFRQRQSQFDREFSRDEGERTAATRAWSNLYGGMREGTDAPTAPEIGGALGPPTTVPGFAGGVYSLPSSGGTGRWTGGPQASMPSIDFTGMDPSDQQRIMEYIAKRREGLGGELAMQRGKQVADSIRSGVSGMRLEPEDEEAVHLIAAIAEDGGYERNPWRAWDDVQGVVTNARLRSQGQGRLEQGDRRLDITEGQGQQRLDLAGELGRGRLAQGDTRLEQGAERLTETTRSNRAREGIAGEREKGLMERQRMRGKPLSADRDFKALERRAESKWRLYEAAQREGDDEETERRRLEYEEADQAVQDYLQGGKGKASGPLPLPSALSGALMGERQGALPPGMERGAAPAAAPPAASASEPSDEQLDQAALELGPDASVEAIIRRAREIAGG